MRIVCPTCNGARIVERKRASREGERVDSTLCPTCDGDGTVHYGS